MEPPNGRWRPCSPKKNHSYCRCRWSRSVITNMASGPCIWMVASEWRGLITAFHPAVEEARAAALGLGIYGYRFIRRFLERRPQLTLRQVDPLIRELTQYRDLINTKIQEQNHEPD